MLNQQAMYIEKANATYTHYKKSLTALTFSLANQPVIIKLLTMKQPTFQIQSHYFFNLADLLFILFIVQFAF